MVMKVDVVRCDMNLVVCIIYKRFYLPRSVSLAPSIGQEL